MFTYDRVERNNYRGIREIMERNIPKKYIKLYNKGIKTSRKAAIRSFCLECMGYLEQEVILCPDTTCPLYKWRETG